MAGIERSYTLSGGWGSVKWWEPSTVLAAICREQQRQHHISNKHLLQAQHSAHRVHDQQKGTIGNLSGLDMALWVTLLPVLIQILLNGTSICFLTTSGSVH